MLPDCTINGCFFHLLQSIWRKLQSLGLQSKYIEDEAFALYTKMIPALAFVPENDVVQAFNKLSQIAPAELLPLLEYFQPTYVIRNVGLVIRGPIFPVEKWNVLARIDLDLPKTNNFVEGWRNGFQYHVGAAHPSIFKFLEILRQEENTTRVKLIQTSMGRPIPPPKRKYADLHMRIRNITQKYNAALKVDYLFVQ